MAVFNKFAGLAVLTIFVIGLMGTVLLGEWNRVLGYVYGTQIADDEQEQIVVAAPTPVSVKVVRRQVVDITAQYSGMIRPWERYRLAFELGGRVKSLGTNPSGEPLDEGQHVTAGQIIAQLDARILVAEMNQAMANQEKAQSDINRAKSLRARNSKAITDADYQAFVTELALADARFDVAEKRLEDTDLLSPVDGVISRRMINAGESVNPQQPLFEIIQVDQVLLVIGVPESRVREVREGQPVVIRFLGTDRFRRQWPSADGRVHQVGQTADDKTGLFEVEIVIGNLDHQIRPGLIGVGEIVVDRIDGFRVPVASAVFRDGKSYLYAVDASGTARQFELTDYVEQGGELIIPDLPPEFHTVIVRGQRRLVDGRAVEVVAREEVDTLDIYSRRTDVELNR